MRLAFASALAFSACASASPQDAASTAETAVEPEIARAFGGERFAIDHIFVFADWMAPEMTAVQELGVHRWPFPNVHNGQGTTGAYFYFDNVYIEFLWVHAPDEATANTPRSGSDFNVRQAWRDDPSISPFGIGLKDYNEGEPSPIETESYESEWMRGEFALYPTVASKDPHEPWTFFLPLEITGEARAEMGPKTSVMLEHPNGIRVLTGVTLVLPEGQEPSDTLRTLEAGGVLKIESGDEHLIKLEFDHGVQGETADLRPRVPMIFEY